MKNLFLNKQQEKLVEDNLGFAIDIANQWSRKSGMDREELQSFALESLSRAAKTYNPEKKTKFLTYAHYVIRNSMLTQVKKYNDRKELEKNVISIFKDEEKDFADNKNNISYAALIVATKEALDSLPNSQKEATLKHVMQGESLSRLSKEFGVSMTTMYKWVKNSKEILRKGLS